MPTPREAYVNTVEAAPVSGQRLRAADYGAAGETLGRAAQGFGRDLQQVGSDLDDVQTIYAVAAAKKADTAAMPRLTAILTAVKNTEGFNTTAAMTQAQADIEALEKEHLATLKNPRAQRMFQENFAQRKANALATMSEYEHDQVRIAGREEDKSHLEASMNNAADNYSNKDEFDRNVGAGFKDVESIYVGAGAATIAQQKAKVLSGVHALVIEKLAAEGNSLGAEAWRLAHSAEIDPDTETKLMRGNAAGLFDSRIDIMWDKIASGGEVAPVAPAANDAAPRTVNVVRGSDYSPVGNAGRRGQGAAQHAARGSQNKGIDFAAPAGTPIRPPTSGIVDSKGFSAENGNFVRVKYSDGNIGIFLHMKGESPLKPGEAVEPGTIIGAVGSTGKSSGNHVHYSVRDSAGNFVDPDTLTYQDGGPRSPRYKPEDTDTAALFNRIYSFAETNNLTGKETDALVARASAYANRNQALRNEQENRATDAAMERATALGEGLTKPSQIPGYSDLTWQTKDRIDGIIERNTTPKEPKANGDAFIAAMEAEIEDPDIFLGLNPEAMPITRAEMRAIVVKQAKLRNPDGSKNESAVDQHNVVNERVNTYLRVGGVVQGNSQIPTATRENARNYVIRTITAHEAAKGRKLNYDEVDAIAQEAATMVTFTRNGKREQARRFAVGDTDPAVQNRSVGKRDALRYQIRRADPSARPTDAELDALLARKP